MLLEHQRTISISIAFSRLLAHGKVPSVVVEATLSDLVLHLTSLGRTL